ncbi:MAG: hypothetical protein IJD92_04635 [Bacilli bacterium]|nr:hypothetical protein [Bacilli bacterium]
MVVPIQVANSILKKSFEEYILLTPLKLNFLIYFLYRDYLFNYNSCLFSERFTLTKSGPILYSIFNKFGNQNKNILTFGRNALKEVSVANGKSYSILLDYVWNKYKNYSELELFDIISRENSAYLNSIKSGEKFLLDKYILDEAINIHEKVLLKAKELRKKI